MCPKLLSLVTKQIVMGNRTKLMDAIGGKSERTLLRWMKQGVPSPEQAFKLARACGCSEKEALALAEQECEVGQTA